MKNKKAKAAATATALVGVMLIGGIMAYFTDGDTATNKFTVGQVSLDLQETKWDVEAAEDMVPEQEVAKNPTIVNDGINDEYVFMTVTVPYYNLVTASEAGTVSAAANQPLYVFGGNGKTVTAAGNVPTPQEIQNAVNDGWTLITGTYNLPDTANTADFTSDTELNEVTKTNGTVNESTTTTDPEQDGLGKDTQTKAATYPFIDETNHQITYLFAYTGDSSKTIDSGSDSESTSKVTMKVLKGSKSTGSTGETTPALFDYVKLVNITEDQKNKTALEESSQIVVVNAYGIQTTNINDGKTVVDGDNTDGKTSPLTVWAVLAKQSPEVVQAAGTTEYTDADAGKMDVKK
jgi:predicted ribosomally synthesized peptide with SipW-like signal peptide